MPHSGSFFIIISNYGNTLDDFYLDFCVCCYLSYFYSHTYLCCCLDLKYLICWMCSKKGRKKAISCLIIFFLPCNLLVDLEIEAGIFVNMIFFLGSLES